MEKIITKYILSAVLFVFGCIVSVATYNGVYPTVIQRFDGMTYTSGQLTGPAVIRGTLIARFNSLGSVQLTMTTYNRINYDTIRFRLKEAGATEWLVDNSYAVDRFSDGRLYAFGFPVIRDSMGKSYEFELTSSGGTKGNSVGVTGGYHRGGALYVYQKSDLLADKRTLLTFVKAKILSILSDVDFYPYVLLFIFPSICLLFKSIRTVALVYASGSGIYAPYVVAGWGVVYLAAFIWATSVSGKFPSSRLFGFTLMTMTVMLFLVGCGLYAQAVGMAQITFVLFSISFLYALNYAD